MASPACSQELDAPPNTELAIEMKPDHGFSGLHLEAGGSPIELSILPKITLVSQSCVRECRPRSS